MFKYTLVVVLLALVACSQARASGKYFDNMMVVFFENAAYASVIANNVFKNTSNYGTLLTNYYALTHPSQPNYIGTVGGDYWGIHTDSSHNLNYTNLVDLLEAKGVTWKGYQEDYPGSKGNCFTGNKYPYMRKHNPFMSFDNIRETPRCDNIVNATELWTDIANKQVPQFSFYTPNMMNDGHDSGIAGAAKFLEPFFDKLYASGIFSNTLLVITFDEDDYIHIWNRVYTLLVGASAKRGAQDSTTYSHYSIMKTAQANWGLDSLNRGDKDAAPFKFD